MPDDERERRRRGGGGGEKNRFRAERLLGGRKWSLRENESSADLGERPDRRKPERCV